MHVASGVAKQREEEQQVLTISEVTEGGQSTVTSGDALKRTNAWCPGLENDCWSSGLGAQNSTSIHTPVCGWVSSSSN